MSPQSSNRAALYLIVGIVLFCVLVIGVGLFLNSRTGKPDWANGPISPGAYHPTTSPAQWPPPTSPGASLNGSPQLLLGNPSDALADPSSRDNYLMVKPYYALSYNNSKGTPNWVSWRVQQSDLGTAPRKQTFDADDTLPDGFYRVVTSEYAGSSFDRGHMCPHSDRAATMEMSYATFVMSNIIPQAPDVNRKAWAQLETYCRELVSRQHDRLYITSGPFGRGGTGSKGPALTLAGGRITVPAECWKVIVVVPESGGDDDLAKVTGSSRVICVDMPNDNDRVGEEWAGFRCSPSSVEAKTGLHFFDRVPPAVRTVLEQAVDTEPIPPPRPLVHTGE